MNANARKQNKEILRRFIEVFCHAHCDVADGELCEECADLLTYAFDRVDKCPFDPKPICKSCKVYCYKGAYRVMIREVMRFSGMHFAKRGRIDWLLKYFLANRSERRAADRRPKIRT